MSVTFTFRSSSTSCSAVGSACDSLTGGHLLREDVFHRGSFLVAGDLPLRGVALGNREPLRCPELVRDRLDPLDELFEPRARGNRLAPLQIDQLAGEPVADRTPEILLQQAVG